MPEVYVDEVYTDAELARLYDAENPWHPMDDFYLALDLGAGSVLDVGCGTGTRLARAREVGHTGRLVGVDPAQAMLEVARGKRDDVEWARGDAQSLHLGVRFDLVTMTGHAFQLLLDDAAVRAALGAFRRHLAAGGLLAFETRNPSARAWAGWTPERTRLVVRAPDGEPFETWVQDAREHDGDLVTFTCVVRSRRTGRVRTSASTLRFVDPTHLRGLLEEAGFEVEGWFGDWDRTALTRSSPEVIVLAR
jgi:ubiquinone/menaquinone biosynthesis C-methylase UbiE